MSGVHAFDGAASTGAPSAAGASEAAGDAYTGDPAPEAVQDADGPPDAREKVQDGNEDGQLVEVRATVNMRGLSRGQVTTVDPTDPTIAMLLKRQAIVPTDS